MKVSIIVPVYNCEKYIKKCIESIINQTYHNWELILIDDGSKDKSYIICEEYSKSDERIFVLKQDNQGAGVARNYGIDKAVGDYIMFCDADDFFEQNCLEIFVENILKSNVDLVISGYNEFKYDLNGNILICHKNNAMNIKVDTKEEVRKFYIPLYRKALNQAPWAKIYNLKIIKENNIRFGDYRRCQDTIFNVKYYDYISNIIVIPNRLYNYQTPDGNVYISKFPVNMIDIKKNIDMLITSYLKKWEVYNEEARVFLNSVLATDIIVCCRLNYLNNWNFNKEQQELYLNKLLSDEKVNEVLNGKGYGKKKDTLCKILKTKNKTLIKFMNFIVVQLQKLKNKVK